LTSSTRELVGAADVEDHGPRSHGGLGLHVTDLEREYAAGSVARERGSSSARLAVRRANQVNCAGGAVISGSTPRAAIGAPGYSARQVKGEGLQIQIDFAKKRWRKI
jgi:hypothetical protein